MATYNELYQTMTLDSELKNRVAVAVIVAAESIRNELDTVDNHANRLLWAKAAFESPRIESERMLRALLAANKDLEVSAILAASDAVLQAKVDAAVDLFAIGA
jgi:hypothetical protein